MSRATSTCSASLSRSGLGARIQGMMKRRDFLAAASALAAGSLSGCARRSARRVVLYCSVDDVYARPIVHGLSERTGVSIDAIYDVEAAKTAGLANRIRAEAQRPRGDIFWSSALLQTLLLGREDLLQPYQSPSAQGIDAAFKDGRGLWHAVGVRTRVLVYHQSVAQPPTSLQDLLAPRFRGKVGVSNPQFGTASDWACALGARWGIARTRAYFQALRANGAQVLAGNSVVAERVGAGDLLAGVTDTDDFAERHKSSPALRLSVATAPLEINAVRVPECAALLRGAPHLEDARKVLDALLEERTERQLATLMPGVASSRGREMQGAIPDDTSRWADSWDKLRDPLNEILNG